MLLLNPGPVTLTERVRRNLLQNDLCHREPEFFDLQDEARSRLLAVYELDPAEWTAVLITGSGTGAVESMVASLVPAAGCLLIVENGADGERFTQVAVVHHETTTGRVPGFAFVIARRSALAQSCARSYHLDLTRLARLQERRGTPFTPAVHAYYALVEALREFAEQGGTCGAVPALCGAGLAYTPLHEALKAEGFVIYAGQGDLSKTLFRLSTMGNIGAADMDRLLASFARLLE